MNQVRNFLKEDTGLFEVPVVFKILDAKKDDVSSPVILGANTYVAGK